MVRGTGAGAGVVWPMSSWLVGTGFSRQPSPEWGIAHIYAANTDDLFFAQGYAAARDRLAQGLAAEGYAVLPAEGTYFLSLDLAASGVAADDVTFCERAVREAGVAAIPVSAFYAEDPVTSVVRLCFAKQDETLAAGIDRLGKARALFA